VPRRRPAVPAQACAKRGSALAVRCPAQSFVPGVTPERPSDAANGARRSARDTLPSAQDRGHGAGLGAGWMSRNWSRNCNDGLPAAIPVRAQARMASAGRHLP
jgi:hypothetical protein